MKLNVNNKDIQAVVLLILGILGTFIIAYCKYR